MSRSLRVEADGGSRGNPGVAGYGALVRDDDTGEVLAERAEPLGRASNNVAEYSGLIAGLTAVLAIDPGARVTVAMDSKLVVEQMAGRWKIKHEDMRRLAQAAREVAAQIVAAGGSIRYTWIPRAQNGAADRLSNDGMDGHSVCRGAGCADPSPTGRPGEDPSRAGSPPGENGTGPDERGEAGPGERRDSFALPTDPLPSGEPTRIVFVRHGVTDLTEHMRLDGRGGLDPPLSPLGESQAANAGRLVADLVAGAAARVVSSDLARARQTGAAVAAALGVDAEIDDAWDEQNYGDWDGAAMADLLRDQKRELGHLRADPAYKRPGGESHVEVEVRVLAAYDALVARGGLHVVVCHRKPIMIVLARILGLSMERAWRLATGPGSLTGVEAWSNGAATVAFTNRT